MFEHRFDDLARALAVGVSRRRMMRLLVAGTAVVLGARLVRTQAAVAAASPADGGCCSAGQGNTIQGGSCTDFGTCVAQRGVQDSRGTFHKSFLGATVCGISQSGAKYKLIPKASSDPNLVCRATTPFTVKFKSAPTIAILAWQPAQEVSKECQQELDRIQKAAQAHEEIHAKQHCKTVAQEAGKRWKKRVFEACASTSEAAIKAVNDKVRAALAAESQRVDTEAQQLFDEFHATPEGQPITIGCDKCPDPVESDAATGPFGRRAAGGGVCCAPGLTNCGGTCVDLLTDGLNCGACGNACGGERTCLVGQCVCTAGRTDCGGVCRDLATDRLNCGSCGAVCPPGRTCRNSQCACPTGTTECNGQCRNLSTDPANCGTCGNACPGGKRCENGDCVCPPNTKECGNICCDPATCCCVSNAGVARCCAPGFVCKIGCNTPVDDGACCREGTTSCCAEGTPICL